MGIINYISKKHLVIYLVLILAFLLRFYRLFDIPFTHDEFSTLFRTNFNSFTELINKGVKIDAHPAGLQVWVYYYKQLFGQKEWVIKLPFILFGFFSILIFYKVFSRWYNQTMALFTVSFMATLQYFVMYSQIARPYSSGLFFVSMLVFIFDKLVFEKKSNVYYFLLYSFFGALSLYNHHFSALLACIITVTGLVLVNKSLRLRFTLSGVLMFVLYLPHVTVFLDQLKLGGLGEWLNKPTLYFLIDYLKYFFGFSFLNLLLLICLIIFSFFNFSYRNYFSKYTFVCFIWFFFPLLIGFLYSIYRAPVLQYSVLIFGAPFLFPLFFAGIKQLSQKSIFLVVCIILILNSYVLIKERKHYDIFYNSGYQAFLKDYPKHIASKNIAAVFDAEYSHKKIIQHYIRHNYFTKDFYWAESCLDLNDWIDFVRIKARSNKYFYYASVFDSDPNFLIVLLDYFPNIEFQKNYMGATIYLLRKGSEQNFILKNECIASKGIAKLEDEYSSGKSFYLNKLIVSPMNLIDISLTIDKLELNQSKIVSSIELNDSVYDWRGADFNLFKSNIIHSKVKVHLPVKLSDININNQNLILKTYLWKSKNETFKFNNYSLKVLSGNPRLYGLFNPIFE